MYENRQHARHTRYTDDDSMDSDTTANDHEKCGGRLLCDGAVGVVLVKTTPARNSCAIAAAII